MSSAPSCSRATRRSARLIAHAVAIAILLALGIPGIAQEGGTIRGTVVDQVGQVVGDAVVVVNNFGTPDSFEIPTAADGRYSSDGLKSGLYTVTATKGDLGGEMFRVRVRNGHTVQVNFVLGKGQRVATWLTEARERESFSRAFSAGIEASRSGRYDEAIEEFEQALGVNPGCLECNFNLAVTLVVVGRLNDAETSFLRAVDIRPDYAAAFYGLSDLYRRQNRVAEATEARSEANRLALKRLAVGRAQAEDAVTRGLTFLNAGNVADAVGRFEAALARDPGFAPAYFWLGTGLVELGRGERTRHELEHYLKLDPTGEFSDRARDQLSDLP